MTKPEDLIDRQAVIKELDLIYDCADMVFEPDDHCCHRETAKDAGGGKPEIIFAII